jgi:hypothetical protein
MSDGVGGATGSKLYRAGAVSINVESGAVVNDGQPTLLSAAIECFDSARRLSIPDGLWLCHPGRSVRDCLAWVLPPSGHAREGSLDVGFCPDLRVEGRDTIAPELYRSAFHARPCIDAVWGRHFERLENIPGAAPAHQDDVVTTSRG